jgi:hypothetical protein
LAIFDQNASKGLACECQLQPTSAKHTNDDGAFSEPLCVAHRGLGGADVTQTKVADDVGEHARERTRDLNGFDYNATAGSF